MLQTKWIPNVLGIEVWESESSSGHSRSVSGWFWRSVDDFLEVSVSVENVAPMMNLRRRNVLKMMHYVTPVGNNLLLWTLMLSREALRVLPAETLLTVHRRRLVKCPPIWKKACGEATNRRSYRYLYIYVFFYIYIYISISLYINIYIFIYIYIYISVTRGATPRNHGAAPL